MIRVGKELDRLDVGDCIHHLTGHHRPRSRPARRPCPDSRQKPADQREIPDQPDREPDRHPPVYGQQQEHGTSQRREGEGDDVDHLRNDLGHGFGGLHFLLRDPTGEIVVKEPDCLAKGPVMQPQQHHRVQIRLYDDRIRSGRQAKEQRSRHEEEGDGADQQPDILPGKKIVRTGEDRAIDDQTQNQGRTRFKGTGRR